MLTNTKYLNTTKTHITSIRKHTSHISHRSFGYDVPLFLLVYILCFVIYKEIREQKTNAIVKDAEKATEKLPEMIHEYKIQQTELLDEMKEVIAEIMDDIKIREAVVAETYETIFSSSINFALFCLIANVFCVLYFYNKYKK